MLTSLSNQRFSEPLFGLGLTPILLAACGILQCADPWIFQLIVMNFD
jgi:hypothetical protein